MCLQLSKLDLEQIQEFLLSNLILNFSRHYISQKYHLISDHNYLIPNPYKYYLRRLTVGVYHLNLAHSKKYMPLLLNNPVLIWKSDYDHLVYLAGKDELLGKVKVEVNHCVYQSKYDHMIQCKMLIVLF